MGANGPKQSAVHRLSESEPEPRTHRRQGTEGRTPNPEPPSPEPRSHSHGDSTTIARYMTVYYCTIYIGSQESQPLLVGLGESLVQ